MRSAALRRILVLGISLGASGCSDLLGVSCTDELVPSLRVEVRDETTGAPAARGVTGVAEHESGAITDLAAFDDLQLHGEWRRELPGRHMIHLRKPGFETEVLRTSVDENRCHVETRTVEAEISSDPQAVRQDALSFTEGPEISAWPASAGIQVFGDTLQISGFARTDCRELRAVAYQLGTGLHVQIEPSDVTLESCAGHQSRQFDVSYLLSPEISVLLVTNGFGFPVDLFGGNVRAE